MFGTKKLIQTPSLLVEAPEMRPAMNVELWNTRL